ncbi:hypothetical protein TNCV_4085151 [Trichonephila clavipes]|nr:hypothetical protein TNCV_4085151 [Trichonephila clavipes]
MQDDISVIPCRCRPRVATSNLSNSCTCGLEHFPSARNDTLLWIPNSAATLVKTRPSSSFPIILPRVKSSRSSCAVEYFHCDASLQAVDPRAPNNSRNWQWTTEGDVCARRSMGDE